VTVYTRKWGEYWQVLVTLKVFKHASGQYYEIDHERIAEIIELSIPQKAVKAKEDQAEVPT